MSISSDFLYNLDPTIWGPIEKNLGAKSFHNLTRFRTTLDFDRECLRNWSKYRPLEN